MRRKVFSVFLLPVLLISMAITPTSPVSSAPQPIPLKIGLITDLSTGYSIYGIELRNGLALGIEYATHSTNTVAGRPVEIVVRDYANDATLAENQARELIETEGVALLVGAPFSSVTQGLINVAAEHDVILMAGPAADPRITGEWFAPTTFRACHNAYQDALGLAAWAVANVGKEYIQFAPDYAYGYGTVTAFDYAFKAKGGEFAADPILVPLDTTEFTPYLQQVVDSGPDGIIISWVGASSVDLFQQAAALGLGTAPDRPAILTGFNSNDIVKAFGDPSQIGHLGTIVYQYALPTTEANDWLVRRYQEAYHDVPDLFSECGFATGQAIAAALDKTAGATSTDALIPALEGLSWEGPKGTYTLRPEDHQALMPVYIVRLANLDDPDQKYYELVAEVSAEDAAPPCESGADRSSEALDCTPLAQSAGPG